MTERYHTRSIWLGLTERRIVVTCNGRRIGHGRDDNQAQAVIREHMTRGR